MEAFFTPGMLVAPMDVLLVGLGNDLTEMRSLIASAGYRLIDEFVQRRTRPDPRTFVGKGKLESLKERVEALQPQAVVFGGVLRPVQHHELEGALKVQCFDRLRVILEIFAQRAHAREAKLQVELAMLQYEIPILREWIHSASAGERPGFMAGGEYRVDAYHETVKRKMKKVRDELKAIRRERAYRREHRRRRGFYHVSIAGYANAGKSSLFNALSGEKVLVEDRLFTTLSTTTRSLRDIRKRILLTDTVGLVADVPLWLVEAFHATFEEVYDSDLVLLLIDASEPEQLIRERVQLAADTLVPGISPERIQPVLTKRDLVDAATIEGHMEVLGSSPFPRRTLSISVGTGTGLEDLHESILQEFRYPMEMTVRVPPGEGAESFLSWLHDRTDVISITYADGVAEVQLRCRERDLSRIQGGSRVVSGPVPVT